MVTDYTKNDNSAGQPAELNIQEPEYGGFWIRVAASLLDGVFTQIITFIISFAMAVIFMFAGIMDADDYDDSSYYEEESRIESTQPSSISDDVYDNEEDFEEAFSREFKKEFDRELEKAMTTPELIIFATMMLAVSLYYIILTASDDFKGTLGKYIVALEVRDINGNKLTWLRSTGRYLAMYISFALALISFGAPYWMVGLNRKKRALHDYIAGTVVIHRVQE